MFRRCQHVFAFSGGDVMFGVEIPADGERFHLDKDGDISLPGDYVYFTVRRAVVAGKDLTASLGEKFGCGRLSPSADLLVVFCHETNRSSSPRKRTAQLLLRGWDSWTSLSY